MKWNVPVSNHAGNSVALLPCLASSIWGCWCTCLFLFFPCCFPQFLWLRFSARCLTLIVRGNTLLHTCRQHPVPNTHTYLPFLQADSGPVGCLVGRASTWSKTSSQEQVLGHQTEDAEGGSEGGRKGGMLV